jgi:hypothetical protein
MTRCSSAMSPTRTRMTPRGPHRRAAELERRPGHGSRARPLRDPAPTGGSGGRRPNSLRHHGRAGGSPAVASGSYPPSACGGGLSAWSAPPTTRARGPRRARPWPAASRVAGAPHGCAVQVVARSEQQATGHALHGHRWLLSQHRAPRRLHAAPAEAAAQQQDRSARRL